jgi:hypothetical protein
MCARQGLKLPNPPSPTHHSTTLIQKPLKTSWGYVTSPPHNRSFPHMQITIRDAIGDLPPFDWYAPIICSAQTEFHPHRESPSHRHDAELEQNAWPTVRPRGDGRCGLPERGEFLRYRMESFTDYQRWVRGNQASVSHHYTIVFDEAVTKR